MKFQYKINMKTKSYWKIDASDYHLFQHYKYAYQKAGIPAKYNEVGCDGNYHAVFWVGKKTKEIQDVITKVKSKYEV
jgi:hypothetical protein